MKITFVMPMGGISGGGRVVAIHAGNLAARGHEVTVVWHRSPDPTWRAQIRALSHGRLLPRPEQGSMLFDGLQVRQVVPAHVGPITDADVPDADVVIATWWETAFEVAALSPQKGEKFYFVQHHEVHDHLPAHITRGTYYLPLHKIAVSPWLVRVMAEEYGDRDVDLVENSVDPAMFHAPLRGKNAVPVAGLMYARIGFKGVDISLAAFEAARREVPELRLRAFGKVAPGPDLPLPEGADFVLNPPQDAIRDIYAGCDVWLFASRSEGYGLPLLEAMACRTPVVATAAGAAPHLIENGKNGFVVDINDADAMAARLVEMARMPAGDWRKMSDAAHARATSYSWDDAGALFEAALLRRMG